MPFLQVWLFGLLCCRIIHTVFLSNKFFRIFDLRFLFEDFVNFTAVLKDLTGPVFFGVFLNGALFAANYFIRKYCKTRIVSVTFISLSFLLISCLLYFNSKIFFVLHYGVPLAEYAAHLSVVHLSDIKPVFNFSFFILLR